MSTAQVFTGLTVSGPTNRWIEVSLEITLENGGTVVGSVDGVSIPMFSLTGANPGLGTVDLYTTGTGNGLVYFDDYSAVPEPSALALLVLASIGMIARHRRK